MARKRKHPRRGRRRKRPVETVGALPIAAPPVVDPTSQAVKLTSILRHLKTRGTNG